MAEITCKFCDAQIPLSDVNVSSDIALCRKCGKSQSYIGQLVGSVTEKKVDLTRIPKGISIENRFDGFSLAVSTRSLIALFLIPFTFIWTGFSMTFLYGTQFASGEFDLFTTLFGIPFLIGSVVLIFACIMAVMGSVVIHSSGNDVQIISGVGNFGWKRRFRWSDVKDVRINMTHVRKNNRPSPVVEILLKSGRPIRTGVFMNHQRVNYLQTFLFKWSQKRADLV